MSVIPRPEFPMAADELASSTAVQAGSSVPGRSEGPAPIPRNDVKGHFRADASLRPSARAACDATVDASPASVIRSLFEEAKRGHTAKRQPAIHGYSSFDIEFAHNGIEAARDLFLSAVKGYLESNEHVASMVDFEDFAACLHDYIADALTGPLQKRIDELRGDR